MSETQPSPAPPAPAKALKDFDAQQLDELLQQFDGDRDKASASIGVTPRQLGNRVNCFKDISLKWSVTVREVVKAMSESENALSVIETMLAQAHVSLNDHRHKLVEDIKRIRDRLDKGEQARFSDDPKMAAYRFVFTAKGEPAEEAMLWENLSRLYELLIKHTSTFERGVASKVKLHLLLQKASADKNGIDPMKRAKPGFRPKGMMSARTIQLLAPVTEETVQPEPEPEPKPLSDSAEWEQIKAEIKGTA